MPIRPLRPALAALILCTATPALAEISTSTDMRELAVTIYNDNLGLVREVRKITLGTGTRELQYAGVASGLDATSVSLKSLDAPRGLQVLEQNYEYDLMTPQKMLEKYVGQEVEVQTDKGVEKATVLSTQSGVVLKLGDRIHLTPPGRVILPRVPENLVARPTLKWLLANQHAGEQRTEVSYLTTGMGWHADYVLAVNPKQDQADLNGWVTIANTSGATYPNATLTLIAGDVNRVREQVPTNYARAARSMVADGAGEQFAEKALFEYHSYQLQRPATLKESQTKQISLLAAAQVPVAKVFRFEAHRQPIWYQFTERQKQKVDVYLTLNNSARDHLGMPLPKGKVRVYQRDTDQRMTFIGEDAIDHTPRDEKLMIKVGQAFDVVGERRQTSYKVLGTSLYETAWEVSLRNHKDEPVTIQVGEVLGGDWEITQRSHAFTRTSATTVEFPVKVGANQEVKVTYTVRVRT